MLLMAGGTFTDAATPPSTNPCRRASEWCAVQCRGERAKEVMARARAAYRGKRRREYMRSKEKMARAHSGACASGSVYCCALLRARFARGDEKRHTSTIARQMPDLIMEAC